MSTPMDGQALPEGFDSTVGLTTGPAVDQRAVAAAQGRLKAAQGRQGWTGAKVSHIQELLKAKGISADRRKALQVQLKIAQTGAASAKAAATVAQTTVYKVSGQYDKLLTGANRDAYAALQTLFNGYGLGSLAGKIFSYVKQGYGADTISLLLQDTKEYKQRFAGNEARAKAGLPVLSPADYLSTEESYRQILQDAGMPKGMYDNPADFQRWIAGDVSPTEVKARVDQASAAVQSFNSGAVQALDQLYGIDSSHLLAYAFDEKTALPVLQKQFAAAQLGGEALQRGLAADRTRLEGYVNSGLSLAQASAGFEQVAEELPNLQALAERWGTTFGQAEEEGATFGTSQQATQKRKVLASQERALFSGTAGGAAAGLSPGYRQT